MVSTIAARRASREKCATALRYRLGSHGDVVAKVEHANNRMAYSMESGANKIGALLHEWRNDLLRIWIPLIAGAAKFIGVFAGFEIQGCRNAAPHSG